MTLVKTNGCKGFIVYLICDQDAIPNKKCLNDKQNLLDTQQMDIGAATQASQPLFVLIADFL